MLRTRVTLNALSGSGAARPVRRRRRGRTTPPWRAARPASVRRSARATAPGPPRRERSARPGPRRRRRRARPRPTPRRTRMTPGPAPSGTPSSPAYASAGSSTAVIRSPRSSVVSRSGSSPGSRYRSPRGIARGPPGPSTCTTASSAASATAMSEGWVATQCGDPPRMARLRWSPARAGQPEPGTRLLQGLVTSWKYRQRVRCSRLPPTVAMFRSWPDAPASTA